MGNLIGLTGTNSYFLAIVILYMQFNLLKGGCIAFIALSVGDTILAFYRMKLRLKK